MYIKSELREEELLIKAVDAFQLQTGLKARVVDASGQTDAVVVIEPSGERFNVEVKKWVQHANIGALIEIVHRLPQPTILIADYINPSMADRFKEHEVSFIDATGNAYIKVPSLFVFVKGNKPKKVEIEQEELGRAFSAKGLRVIFSLLANPQLLQTTYREIAVTSGVSLGTVTAVMNDLKDRGYVRETGRNMQRRIDNFSKLLDRWVELYPEKLRPKLAVGEFIAEEPDWWRNFDITKYKGFWGGEVAAALTSSYLKPEVTTIYLPKESGNQLLVDARLKKATSSNRQMGNLVRIFRPFWERSSMEKGIVPVVLIYADLVATADPRNLETARMVYDEINVPLG